MIRTQLDLCFHELIYEINSVIHFVKMTLLTQRAKAIFYKNMQTRITAQTGLRSTA